MAKTKNQNSGCLTVFLSLLGIGQGKSSGEHPYRIRDNFLTAAEMSFYGVLKGVVGDRAVIVPQAGLWNIFYVPRNYEAYTTAMNHVDRKHVDFLLCNRDDMQPMVAIELDDSSHRRPDRQTRDAVVDAVFEEADLPLLHIPTKRGYDTRELQQMLTPYLPVGIPKTTPQQRVVPPSPVNVVPDGKPLCPKCGSPMVLRVAKTGTHQGEQFYACSNYPKCRGIVSVKN